MRKSYSIRNTTDRVAENALIRLYPTKSTDVTVLVASSEVEPRPGHTWSVRFGRGVPPGESVRIDVDYRSEPVALFRIDWGEPWDVLGEEPRDLVEHRRAAVAAIDDPTKPWAEYFLEFDMQISQIGMQALLDQGVLTAATMKDRLEIYEESRVALTERLRVRWDSYNLFKQVPDEANLAGLEPDKIEHFSDLQLTVLEEAFGADWRLKRDDVEGAYEWFSSGRLATPNGDGAPWGGQPDSGQVFMFAEFAMMCVERLPSARDDWLLLANILVRMQEIFTASYACGNALTCPAWKALSDYSPPVNAPMPVADIEALRATYDAKTWWDDAPDRENRLAWLRERHGHNLWIGMTRP